MAANSIKTTLIININSSKVVERAVLMDIEGNKMNFSSMPKGMKTPKLGNRKHIAARSSQMISTMSA